MKFPKIILADFQVIIILISCHSDDDGDIMKIMKMIMMITYK